MYRIRVTVAGKRWPRHNWDDPMMKVFIIEEKVLGLFWVKVDVVFSEYSARHKLDKLREIKEKQKTAKLDFNDYILEEK